MGGQGLLLLIDLTVLIMMTSLQNTLLFACSKYPAIDGIKATFHSEVIMITTFKSIKNGTVQITHNLNGPRV